MKQALSTVWLLIRRTAHEYSADNCSHMAAAISYYVIFSIIPLTIFTVSIFGMLVRDDEIQEDVSREIVDFLNVEAGVPLLQLDADAIVSRYDAATFERLEETLLTLGDTRKEELATQFEETESVVIAGVVLGTEELSVRSDNVIIDTIRGVSDVSGALAIVGLVGMGWAGSAMFGAIRKSLNIAWDAEAHRPVVQQKLVDLAMVLGIGILIGASVGITAALHTVRQVTDDALGPLSGGTAYLWAAIILVLPGFFSFSVFTLVYRYVPNAPTSFRHVWPGALLAALLFELLTNGFAFYVANFNNYAGLYGALGGILLFLLWTYVASNILLVGAELAAEYPRVLRGDYAALEAEAATKEKRSLPQTVLRAVRGLFLPHPDEPSETKPSQDTKT